VNDTASFDNTFEGAAAACILKIRIMGSTISIISQSESFNCGFGNNVNADGEYERLKDQPVVNNEWLKKQYHESPSFMISSNKVQLFQDENALHPFVPQQWLSKDVKYLSVSETEKTVYTEYFTSNGKFIYGWVKKTEMKRANE
jgi:hypothetical protein